MVRAGMWENKVLKLDFWAPFFGSFFGRAKNALLMSAVSVLAILLLL